MGAAIKQQLAARLRQVRLELHGEHGGPNLARDLGVHERTWQHYEAGVTIPGEILLRLLDTTGVDPHWLLSGSGSVFRAADERPRTILATSTQ